MEKLAGVLKTRPWLSGLGLLGLLIIVLAVLVARDEYLRHQLDPGVPFQTYEPPREPDYAARSDWLLWKSQPTAGPAPFDVFFVYPTVYSGGSHWNAPLDDPKAERLLQSRILTNFVGPFARRGSLYAPRYRQASLYTLMTNREDSREARSFAYRDVLAAFRRWRAATPPDRPFVLAGVEQGGLLIERLLREEIGPDPVLHQRLVAAYASHVQVPADSYGPDARVPACQARAQAGCLVAWAEAPAEDANRALERLQRGLVWSGQGGLADLGNRAVLCVNPVTGKAAQSEADFARGQGAVNGSDLEWGTRPALLVGQTAARCLNGILRIARPKSPSLKRDTAWSASYRVPNFNLFFKDIEVDLDVRYQVWTGGRSNRITPSVPES